MDFLATGVLKGPHGVLGFIKLHAFSRQSAHLVELREVSLRKGDSERLMTIEEVKDSGRDILVKFAGIDTPEDARKLNGWELWVPRSEAAVLEDGEFYVADLAKCSLTVDGRVVATVVGVIDGPQALLLEVLSLADEKRYLVRFMAPYIGNVDLERMEMELLAPQLLS